MSGYFDNITVDRETDFSQNVSFTVTLKRGSFGRSISELDLEDLVQLHDVLGHVISQETE